MSQAFLDENGLAKVIGVKLPPSSKIFLLVKIDYAEERSGPNDVLDEIQIQIMISNSLSILFGEIDMIGTVPKLLAYDKSKQTFILQSDQKNLEKLRQALFMVNGTSSDLPKLSLRILNVIY